MLYKVKIKLVGDLGGYEFVRLVQANSKAGAVVQVHDALVIEAEAYEHYPREGRGE